MRVNRAQRNRGVIPGQKPLGRHGGELDSHVSYVALPGLQR